MFGRCVHRAPASTQTAKTMEQQALTTEAVERIRAELEELEGEGRKQIQKRIQTAREEGDLRENAEYHEAKEDQGFMEGRIVELRAILDNHVIVEDTDDASAVAPGTRVTIKDADGDVDTFAYTSTLNNVGDLSVISPESPLGAALRGAGAGDTVSYEAPAGTFKVSVVSVERL